jgi:D-3-phosphoglycerate dehydrogenase / 2-oxoglutarate reductase
VAELTLGLALTAARHIHVADRGLKEGKWLRAIGTELKGKQVSVVGYGRIGRTVSQIMAAFGSTVTVVEPLDVATEPFAKVDLHYAVEHSELIALHCPPSLNGGALLTRELLARVRPGLILLNTARRSLVDEEGLLVQLDEGRIAAYGCDVFDQADPKTAELLTHPRVIATPHLGAYTRESVDRAAFEAVQNLLVFFAHAQA